MEDLQGELALILETDEHGEPKIVGYKRPSKQKDSFAKQEVIATFLSASLDAKKYTDHELHTLDSYLNVEVGKKESVHVSTMYKKVDKLERAVKAETQQQLQSKKKKKAPVVDKKPAVSSLLK